VANQNVFVRRFASANELAREVAADVLAQLAQGSASRGQASLLLSGGRSPVGLFERLRAVELDWRGVWVALADERWVDTSDTASNEHLVRTQLLKGEAAAARFVGLKNEASSPELGAARAWQALSRVPRPFDMTILGMGDDGHTASLFPGSPNLRSALDESAADGCVGTCSPTLPHARLSLNLSALLDSRRIVLLMLGESKLRTYVAACRPGPVEEMPVRAVLRQQRIPVEVAWAP